MVIHSSVGEESVGVMYLDLVGGAVGNVRVGALLPLVALEEVARVVLLCDGAGVAFHDC